MTKSCLGLDQSPFQGASALSNYVLNYSAFGSFPIHSTAFAEQVELFCLQEDRWRFGCQLVREADGGTGPQGFRLPLASLGSASYSEEAVANSLLAVQMKEALTHRSSVLELLQKRRPFWQTPAGQMSPCALVACELPGHHYLH